MTAKRFCFLRFLFVALITLGPERRPAQAVDALKALEASGKGNGTTNLKSIQIYPLHGFYPIWRAVRADDDWPHFEVFRLHAHVTIDSRQIYALGR